MKFYDLKSNFSENFRFFLRGKILQSETQGRALGLLSVLGKNKNKQFCASRKFPSWKSYKFQRSSPAHNDACALKGIEMWKKILLCAPLFPYKQKYHNTHVFGKRKRKISVPMNPRETWNWSEDYTTKLILTLYALIHFSYLKKMLNEKSSIIRFCLWDFPKNLITNITLPDGIISGNDAQRPRQRSRKLQDVK